MASYVDPSGTAHLDPADLMLVLDALRTAATATYSAEKSFAWRALYIRLADDR